MSEFIFPVFWNTVYKTPVSQKRGSWKIELLLLFTKGVVYLVLLFIIIFSVLNT